MSGEHLGPALALLGRAYARERRAVACLPPFGELAAAARSNLVELLRAEGGLVALEGSKMRGFILGRRLPRLFGDCAGIHVPLWAHGADPDGAEHTYRVLYTEAARRWVAAGRLSHAVTVFAHDAAVVEIWFWLGFGQRCVDGIRPTRPLLQAPPPVSVERIAAGELPPGLVELHDLNLRHFVASPMFMPGGDRDPAGELAAWLAGSDVHLWMARRDGEPAGYLRLEPAGESLVSLHPQVMNVTGAFVRPRHRGCGVASALLGRALCYLRTRSIGLCGVDYEGFNTVGAALWGRHFTPYTYTLARRVDERVLAGVGHDG